MIKVQYNMSIEVSKVKYHELVHKFSGIIAHRVENNRYFIKVWIMRYKKRIEEILNQK